MGWLGRPKKESVIPSFLAERALRIHLAHSGSDQVEGCGIENRIVEFPPFNIGWPPKPSHFQPRPGQRFYIGSLDRIDYTSLLRNK